MRAPEVYVHQVNDPTAKYDRWRMHRFRCRGDFTVRSLKLRVANKMGVPVERQRLYGVSHYTEEGGICYHTDEILGHVDEDRTPIIAALDELFARRSIEHSRIVAMVVATGDTGGARFGHGVDAVPDERIAEATRGRAGSAVEIDDGSTNGDGRSFAPRPMKRARLAKTEDQTAGRAGNEGVESPPAAAEYSNSEVWRASAEADLNDVVAGPFGDNANKGAVDEAHLPEDEGDENAGGMGEQCTRSASTCSKRLWCGDARAPAPEANGTGEALEKEVAAVGGVQFHSDWEGTERVPVGTGAATGEPNAMDGENRENNGDDEEERRNAGQPEEERTIHSKVKVEDDCCSRDQEDDAAGANHPGDAAVEATGAEEAVAEDVVAVAQSLRQWLLRLGANNGGADGDRFGGYIPAFEREFNSLEDLVLAADNPKYGVDRILQTCRVKRMGDRARIEWAIEKLPRPE